MKPSIGLVGLLALAVLSIVAVVGLTQPIRVQPGANPEPTAVAPTPTDGGSLDSILDAIQVEHGVKHGR